MHAQQVAEIGGGRPARILVVEDDDDLRLALAELLEQEGFHVWEASNGNKALALLKTTVHPDVVVLDYRMPGLDGGEVYERLRAQGLDIPVVLITAAASARSLARRHHISHFLGKPFSVEDLLVVIRSAALQSGRASVGTG